MKLRLWAVFTYPLYKQAYAVVSVWGAVRAITYYMAGHKKPLSVKQMVERGDERVFWLDERFEGNPGWLADEGEIVRQNGNSSDRFLTSHGSLSTAISR